MGALLSVPVPLAAQVLSLELPADLGPEDLDLEVRVVQRGRVLAEGRMQKAAPQPGAHLKVNLDLKRG